MVSCTQTTLEGQPRLCLDIQQENLFMFLRHGAWETGFCRRNWDKKRG